MQLGEEFLSEIIVGEGLGGEMAIGLPTDLNSYQNIGESVVAYWTFSPFVEGFYALNWEVETDLVDTFDSTDYRLYSDTSTPDQYIAGCIHRGMVLPVEESWRIEGATSRLHWRVRAKYEDIGGPVYSDWVVSYYDIPALTREATRTSLLSFLPDALYDKTPGTVPGVGSNVYKIHDNYAKEFDNSAQQLNFVNNDLYVKSARDVALQPNFGDLLGMEKPGLMQVIDYREILKTFMTNIRSAPSTLAIRNLVFAVYQNDPVFRNIRDVYATYVYDAGILDQYVIGPDEVGILADAYIWDNEHLAAGVIIEVYNQLASGQGIDALYVENLVRYMSQAHTPVFVREI